MTETEKPHAPACERNQQVILEQLQQQLRSRDRHVLEVGSGTGQHAVYFAARLPDVVWQTSDITANHAGIKMWLEEAGLANVRQPLVYEIGDSSWPDEAVDVVFTANTLHIMAMPLVRQFILDLGRHLSTGNRVFIYGPFKYGGAFTSPSNADFEQWLQDIDPERGIRDFEVIEDLMLQQGLHLHRDIAMPANNQLLIFEKL